MCKHKAILAYAFIFNNFKHISYEAIFPYKINYKYNSISTVTIYAPKT